MEQPYNYEDRLVRFAGEVVLFIKTIPKSYEGRYFNGNSNINFNTYHPLLLLLKLLLKI